MIRGVLCEKCGYVFVKSEWKNHFENISCLMTPIQLIRNRWNFFIEFPNYFDLMPVCCKNNVPRQEVISVLCDVYRDLGYDVELERDNEYGLSFICLIQDQSKSPSDIFDFPRGEKANILIDFNNFVQRLDAGLLN